MDRFSYMRLMIFKIIAVVFLSVIPQFIGNAATSVFGPDLWETSTWQEIIDILKFVHLLFILTLLLSIIRDAFRLLRSMATGEDFITFSASSSESYIREHFRNPHSSVSEALEDRLAVAISPNDEIITTEDQTKQQETIQRTTRIIREISERDPAASKEESIIEMKRVIRD